MKVNIYTLYLLILIAYLHFLETYNTSGSAMANHLSNVKAKLALFGNPIHIFKMRESSTFKRPMLQHRHIKVNLKRIIDIQTLQLIIRTCDLTYMGQVFKAVYTLAFFSLLLLSNLVLHTIFSSVSFRGDVIFASQGIHILIKWSKKIQTRNVKILKIPFLGCNPIYPVVAVKNLLAITPGGKNGPIFQYKLLKGWFHLTDTQVRCHFQLILNQLHSQDSKLTFVPSGVQVPPMCLILMSIFNIFRGPRWQSGNTLASHL